MKKILWDIDGTLLNFDLAETKAIIVSFEKYKLDKPSMELILDYKEINNRYWKMLERGEVTRQDVMIGRFVEFFKKHNIDAGLAEDFNRTYQIELGKTYVFNPHGEKVVKVLSKSYDQYAVTNGSLTAQRGKLEGSNLNHIFKKSFISELVGFEKPDPRFFSYVFDHIGSNDPSDYVIIGDSLTSDMLGGINSGIKTIWFNPENLKNDLNLKIDYTIKSLDEVIPIVSEIFS